MNDLDRYWTTLGREIELGLSAANGRRTFAAIASEVLVSVPAPEIDVLAMADWAAAQDPLPKQVNFQSSFGQPPLVVYQHPEFFLEVLFWFPSRTEIHGHGFTGAFRVLAGCSLQVEYEFHEAGAPEEGVRIGRLEPRQVEFIGPRTVCAIEGGDEFLHAVAHLGNPSLTLVARTYTGAAERQFAFYRCGFAHRTALNAQSLARQTAVLTALRQARPVEFPRRLLEFLAHGGEHRFFRVLEGLVQQLGGAEFSIAVLPAVEKHFAASRRSALQALREVIKRDLAWNLIQAELDPRTRLRLVLEELLPNERERETLIRRSGDSPDAAAQIERWAALLSGAG